jgi:hypothetical protein
VLRDVLIWSVPALIFGLLLRAAFLSYSPCAYWGSDSRSFLGFTDGVLTKFYFSIPEKRRYLYPLWVFPFSLLPGGTLRWLAIAQAALGLATILPFAYCVRKCFLGWRVWMVPLTVLFAGLPVFLWYEHELIAESLFFQGFVWAMAGWVAWVSQVSPSRARLLWWWFLVPFAIMVLTKPSTKFLWPGLLLALGMVCAWRVLKWKQWTALGVLFFVGLTVGDDDQSAWLLYTSAFPLTQLDSPLHSEYKKEIAPLVAAKLAVLDFYEEEDDAIHDFLRSPEDHPEFPAWHALAKDEPALAGLYKDLALEAILARPFSFLQIGLQRLAGSANMSEFKLDRFEPGYFEKRFREAYEKKRNPESMIRIAFGIPRAEPFPPMEVFGGWVNPRPDSASAIWVNSWVAEFSKRADLLHMPEGQRTPLRDLRPTVFGSIVLLGALLTGFGARRKTLGVWVLISAGYLVLVYLVGIQHTRYFALVWPLVFLLLAVPFDAVLSLFPPFRKMPLGGQVSTSTASH